MRITFITPKINQVSGGGANYSLGLYAQGLSLRGHQVKVLSLHPPQISENHRNYTIEHLPGHPGNTIFRLVSAYRALKRYEAQTDIFHLSQADLAPSGGLYRKWGGKVPVVASLNHYPFCTNHARMDGLCHSGCNLWKRIQHHPKGFFQASSLPLRFLESLGTLRWTKYVDKLLPDSSATGKIYEEIGFSIDSGAILHEAIDTSQIFPRNKSRNTTNHKPWNIVFTGILKPEKGIDLILRSLRHIQSIPFHLHIVGNGQQKKALMLLAERGGLSSAVTFHGYVKNGELPKLYSTMDLFIHPGRWPEPFGRTVAEAMLAELPVLVSEIGYPPQLVGNAGFTFKPNDLEDLVRKILYIWEHPKERALRASRSPMQIKQYDSATVAERLEAIYQSVREAAFHN